VASQELAKGVTMSGYQKLQLLTTLSKSGAKVLLTNSLKELQQAWTGIHTSRSDPWTVYLHSQQQPSPSAWNMYGEPHLDCKILTFQVIEQTTLSRKPYLEVP